jgi:hypothetical protein
MRPLVLAVAFVSAGCGTPERARDCMGTVSGTLMGTFSVCNGYDALYRANTNTFVFDMSYTELPTAFTLESHWELKGEPTAMSYDQDTRDIDCNVTVKKGAQVWLARKGAGVPTSGSCRLTFVDVASLGPMGNITEYVLKGSLAAHLDASPGTGSMGTIDVSMDFDG